MNRRSGHCLWIFAISYSCLLLQAAMFVMAGASEDTTPSDVLLAAFTNDTSMATKVDALARFPLSNADMDLEIAAWRVVNAVGKEERYGLVEPLKELVARFANVAEQGGAVVQEAIFVCSLLGEESFLMSLVQGYEQRPWYAGRAVCSLALTPKEAEYGKLENIVGKNPEDSRLAWAMSDYRRNLELAQAYARRPDVSEKAEFLLQLILRSMETSVERHPELEPNGFTAPVQAWAWKELRRLSREYPGETAGRLAAFQMGAEWEGIVTRNRDSVARELSSEAQRSYQSLMKKDGEREQ